jgi:predicted NBD/HSP70 family sugar kinase
MLQLQPQFPDKTSKGVWLSVPGGVQRTTNRVILAPNLNWKNYDISGELTGLIGLSVELENDANACLLSELWFGRLREMRNVVLVAVSEGVGTTILTEGRLIGGRDGLAKEFGHKCVDRTARCVVAGSAGAGRCSLPRTLRFDTTMNSVPIAASSQRASMAC